MNAPPQVITRSVVLELAGPEGPVHAEAELRYDPSDPYAVTVAFLMGGAEVAWLFGRDLLMRGVSEPVGEGDVQVSPSVDSDGRAVVRLVLHSPSGQALVEARSSDVLAFLAHTTRVVWPGTERDHLSPDDAIAALLVGD